MKNRHHTALFIQNNQLKLLVRKGPLATNEKEIYESEWVWRVPQINDNEWHSYRIVAHYPTKVQQIRSVITTIFSFGFVF